MESLQNSQMEKIPLRIKPQPSGEEVRVDDLEIGIPPQPLAEKLGEFVS